jgi:hypothetical protein
MGSGHVGGDVRTEIERPDALEKPDPAPGRLRVVAVAWIPAQTRKVIRLMAPGTATLIKHDGAQRGFSWFEFRHGRLGEQRQVKRAPDKCSESWLGSSARM